jgi:hypothetical protein
MKRLHDSKKGVVASVFVTAMAGILGIVWIVWPAQPGEPTRKARHIVAALRAMPSSPLRLEVAESGPPTEEHAAPCLPVAAEHRPPQVTLPGHSTEPLRLEEKTAGMAIEVKPREVFDVVAQSADRYYVYPNAHRSGGTLLHRVLEDGAEDFVSFEARPPVPEVVYDLKLDKGVAGLRLVEGTLELLDANGAPRLRADPPFIAGADGAHTDATLAVEGCAVDTNPAGPWNRAVTAPGAASCTLRVRWPDEAVRYPAVLDPKWTTTGSLSVARQDHNLINLPLTAKVLAVGGRSTPTGTTGLASAEIYDKSTGTWSVTGSMSGGRWSASATLLNSSSNGTTSQHVLVAGGINGTTSLNTAQLYNQTAGTWAAAANLNAQRHLHTATLLADGRVLVAGGMNGTTVLQSAALYNPASGSGSWAATTGPIPPPGWRFGTATLIQTSNGQLNNKVLLAGGNDGTQSLSSVFLFDPAQSAFSTLASMPGAREGGMAVVLSGGKLLIAGGKNGSTTLASAVIFDPGSGPGNWSATGNMNSPRWGHAMNLLPTGVTTLGQVIVSGGTNGTTTLSSTEIWNGSAWAIDGAMVAPVQQHASVALGNGILLAGGAIGNGSTTVSAAELYDPSLGLTCTTGSQCASGFCVGGVCCDTACNGGCGSCNLSGKVGTCSPVAAGTTCRASAGICDVAETCSGSSLACPTDSFQSATTVCRASAGICDVAENCTGSSAACPADTFQPSTTVCRPQAGNCDLAESCTGTAATCPPDAFLPATAICRPSVGQCDVAESCTGSSATCPADGFVADGTTCNDGTACTQTDACQGGTCVGSNPVVCTALDACHSVGTCDPGAGTCSNPSIGGTACITGTTLLNCPQGAAMANCVNRIVAQVAASNRTQLSTVVSDLQVLAAYPGFPDALAADALARVNPSGHLNDILVELSMLGKMKTAPGTQTLKAVVNMPLPTSGTCVRQDGNGSACDLREAQYVRELQSKAIDGLAFLRSADGDAAVLAAVSGTNPTLQARAVMAYLWNHGATDANRATLAALLPADRQFLVDRFIKDSSMTVASYNQAMTDFYTKHPELVPPAPSP